MGKGIKMQITKLTKQEITTIRLALLETSNADYEKYPALSKTYLDLYNKLKQQETK